MGQADAGLAAVPRRVDMHHAFPLNSASQLPQQFHGAMWCDVSILFKHLGLLIDIDRRITGYVALPALDCIDEGFCSVCPPGCARGAPLARPAQPILVIPSLPPRTATWQNQPTAVSCACVLRTRGCRPPRFPHRPRHHETRSMFWSPSPRESR